MSKKKDKFIKYASLSICFLVVLLLSHFKVFEPFELQTLDLRFKTRPLQEINPDIVIIEIGEDSIEKIGRWPFDRTYHALLINVLNEAGAKQIIFDIIFSEESPSDSYLIDAAKKTQNVYFPYVFRLDLKDKGEITANSYENTILKELETVSAGSGYINFVPDIDGKIRKIPLYIKFENEYYQHLVLAAVCDYLNIKKGNIEFKPRKYIELANSTKIPLNQRNEILINYAGRWEETFKHYSYVDVIGSHLLKREGEKPLIDLSELEGKVCFIGTTATAAHDLQPIPLAKRYPATGVLANVFNSITINRFLIRVSRLVNLAILIFWISAIVLLFRKSSILKSLIYVISAILCYIFISFILFVYLGIWIDLLYPVIVGVLLYLGLTFYRLIIERHRRELIEKELNLARRIQESFLPLKTPEKEGFKIASSMEAARQVGGDLYQFTNLDEDKFGVMIADVSGKGIPAALFMSKIVTEFRVLAKEHLICQDVLSNLNKQLNEETKTGLFVTMSYAVINSRNKEITLSDGGHLPLLWYQAKSDMMEQIRPSKGMPLGLLPNVEFDEIKFKLSKDDILVFYTDGVTEARNAKGEEFGVERLESIIKKEHSSSASIILESVKNSINEFSKRASQHDDITIIVLKAE